MNEHKTAAPPEFNLLGGIFFVLAGAAIVSDGTFSHMTIGTVSGDNVRAGGFVAAVMGFSLIVLYFKAVAARLKSLFPLVGIFGLLVCGLIVTPFLQDHAGLHLAPMFKIGHFVLTFLVGHILHKKITG